MSDLADLMFMIREMDSLTLGKARILVSAWNAFSHMPEYAIGREKVLALVPPATMDRIVSEIPLGSVRYDALMEKDAEGKYHPLDSDELQAINEAMIVGPCAVFIREQLEPHEYACLIAPWDMVLELPPGIPGQDEAGRLAAW